MDFVILSRKDIIPDILFPLIFTIKTCIMKAADAQRTCIYMLSITLKFTHFHSFNVKESLC